MEQNLTQKIRVNYESLDFTEKNYFIEFVGGVCPKCGVEWYGVWKTATFNYHQLFDGKFGEVVQQEIEKAKNLDQCPFCGSSIPLNTIVYEGYIQETRWAECPHHMRGTQHTASSLQDAYSQMWKSFSSQLDTRRECLPYYDKNDAKDLAEQYVSTWDIPVYSSVSELTTEIKASPEKLKNYISQLMLLESNIYAMTKRLASLYCNILSIKRTVVYEEILLLQHRQSELANAEARLLEAQNVKVKIPTITYPAYPVAPELKKPGFFNKAKILAANKEMTAKYQKEIELYNEKVAMCKNEEARAKEEAAARVANNIEKAKLAVQEAKDALEEMSNNASLNDIPAKTLQISMENEASQVESMLKEMLECRNKLYSYNIVFEKYRNMVTIFTFYEYLASGRCDSLEGAYGAYNIYENEVRANIIIDKLSTIIQKLDEIKQNQGMIYSELKKVNQNLSELNNKMSKAVKSLETIEYNTEITAYNTAVTAYYAQKNAELTNALGYLVAFK